MNNGDIIIDKRSVKTHNNLLVVFSELKGLLLVRHLKNIHRGTFSIPKTMAHKPEDYGVVVSDEDKAKAQRILEDHLKELQETKVTKELEKKPYILHP